MIQPNANAFSYNPFRISFAFSIIFLILWIIFFVYSFEECLTNCFTYYTFINPCVRGGNLYCCSSYDSSGQQYCDYYSSCYLDNTTCGTKKTLAWIFGSLLILFVVLMCFASCQFRKIKNLALIQQQQLMYNQNQGYIPHPYQNQPQPQPQGNYVPPQGNYAPPQYYRQN